MKTNFTSAIKFLFAMLFIGQQSAIRAQTTLYSENFENTNSFTLNSSDLAGSSTHNTWLVNNSYTGGSGTLICLGFPFSFTVANSPQQPIGITGAPTSNYMHISAQTAIASGITCVSYIPADGTCITSESNFAKMTAPISTSGLSGISINFWWLCAGSSTAYGEVYYSLDNGATWILKQSNMNNTANWTQANLTDAAWSNKPSLRFGFRFVNNTAATAADPAFAIDEFKIIQSCTPTSSTLSTTACNIYTSPSGNTWTTSGTYTDTIANVAGCDSVITITLTVNSVNPTIISTSPTLSANPSGASYQWVNCLNNFAVIPGSTSQNFIATANGSYAVIVTQNNCSDTSACAIVANIGLFENDFGTELMLYPNPTSGELSISLGTNDLDFSVSIKNTLGQEVFKRNFTGSNSAQINLPGEAGVYFVEITSADKKALLKVIKE